MTSFEARQAYSIENLIMNNETNFCEFTVLMAVYKGDDSSLFSKALQSVFENTLPPKKVIVVADGILTVEIEAVLESFLHQKELLVIRSACNQGLAHALNMGLNSVKTEFTVRADSDDFNYPNRFQKLLSKLEAGYDLVGSHIIEVDRFGNKLAARNVPLNQEDITSFARKRNPFNHMAVGFRTKCVLSVGGYPKIHLKEDYALWVTLISNNYRVCNINEILVTATTGKDMYRRRGGFKYALAEIDIQIHLARSRLKSPLSAFLDGVLRSLIFLAPSSFREFVYINFLRTKVK